MKRTPQRVEKTKALTISIIVHGALLLSFYFLVFINTSKLPQIINKVTFDLKEVLAPRSVPPPNLPKVTKIIPATPPKPSEELSKEEVPETGEVVQPNNSSVTEKEEIQHKEPSPPVEPEEMTEPDAESTSPPTEELPTTEDPASDLEPSTQEGDNHEEEKNVVENQNVDERALYNLNSKKETGALLELAGWLWDTMPSPQDLSEETGKIVFEIKVDNMGEVISVKTLEKTISASIEKIYATSLEQLTFSKTDEDEDGADAEVSIGKITFFIKAR